MIQVEDNPTRQTKRRCLESVARYGGKQGPNFQRDNGKLGENYWPGNVNVCQVVKGTKDSDRTSTDLSAAPSSYDECDRDTGFVTDSVAVNDATLVCFGAIAKLPVHATPSSSALHNLVLHSVYLESGKILHCSLDGILIGALETHDAEVLSKLGDDGKLKLQLCYSTSAKIGKKQRKHIGFLDVVLYGPKGMGDDVADFLHKCGHYLQPPLGCDRNVPYYNPQSLASLEGNLPMTFDLYQEKHRYADECSQSTNDLLAGFETTEDLPLARTPNALCTALRIHQKQALTFFHMREGGLGATGKGQGIWTRQKNAAGAMIYVNQITGQEQVEQPQAWRGGILADEMGLGKTLSMIALIASDNDFEATEKHSTDFQTHRHFINSTLIIVPPAVLHVWEAQLKQHTASGQITWAKHHLKDRFDAAAAADGLDIVFTTYQTLMSEHKKCSTSANSIFSFHWRRVIIDEAHTIRNRATATAKAITSLHATYRWAISGTPIQNNLADLASIATFLHFCPYDNSKTFDEDFIEPYRSKSFETFVERMTKFLACVMLRRTKAVIELPPKQARIIAVAFTEEEKTHYRSIEKPMAAIFDHAVDNPDSMGRLWLNAMQQINKLRMACNLGVSMTSSKIPGPQSPSRDDIIVSELFANFSVTGDPSCVHCGQNVELSGSNVHLSIPQYPAAHFSSCGCIFCSKCANLLRFSTPNPCACGAIVPSSLQPIPSQDTPRVSPEAKLSPNPQNGMYISSKVQALVSQVVAGLPEKSAVFSFWTASLDMVQQALDTTGVCYVRVDGNVSESSRQRALAQLRNDARVKVILLTISCGAVGIDLTAASKVHLLEPQWNPSLEDQALARVHRIGQSRPVTTYRYYMEDSMEEHIMRVQGDKREMVKLLLSKDSQSLQELRGMLHEQ